jgi:tetratricopeptide (TPR) repeat protein
MDLPFGSRVPVDRNTMFVGREADLRALARALKGGATAAIGQVAAATGLGGIGKTQLASEFVYRYGQYFDGGVYWLSFADPAAIPSEIALCGGAGHLELRPDFASLSLEEQIESVLAAWQSSMPRLLVFDNCEDERLLACWRPRGGGARVLLTSRRAQWPRVLNVNSLRLGVLTRNESIELLRMHRPDLSTENESLNAIADEVGDLPLALHLAGSYLETFRHAKLGTPESYLEQLSQVPVLHHPSLEGEGATASPTDHAQHMSQTFTLSYQQLNADDPIDAQAIALLVRATYFAPGKTIPRDLLLATLHHDELLTAVDEQTSTDLTQTLRDEKALGRLLALGLLEEQADGTLLMHRLLVAFTREASSDATAQNSVEVTLINALGRLEESGNLVKARTLEPHIRAVSDLAFRREDEWVVELCRTLGNHLRTSRDYVGAQLYMERALEVREAMVGKNHPDTALELNDLGYIFYFQRDLAIARYYFERALPLWEHRHDYPNLAATLDNLGQLLEAQGDYPSAQAFYERALTVREQALGPTAPQTAITLHNLGWNLFTQGDLNGARAYLERALAVREQVFREPHRHAAVSLSSMGSVLRAQGDLSGAREYFERALGIFEQVVGPADLSTLTTIRNLQVVLVQLGDLTDADRYRERLEAAREQAQKDGGLANVTWLHRSGYELWEQGDYREARRYYEVAVAIFERIQGKIHPSLSVTLNNLAMVLVPQEDYVGARECYERALAIQERSADSTDLLTARILNNLGVLLRLQGDLDGARARLEQAYAIRKQVFGEDHRDTATTINNLGVYLQAEGNSAEAQRYIERAISICEQVLGNGHPDVARSLNDLGVLLHAKGQLVEARTRLQRALGIREKVLREGHPDIAQSLTNLAGVIADQGNHEEARLLYQRALAIYEEVLGEEHSTTQLVQQNLTILDIQHRESNSGFFRRLLTGGRG